MLTSRTTYVSVKREDVVAHLTEVIEAIHSDNALAGIHCCGNTEWSILIDAGVDIVNFDAFEFGETIAMYPYSVKDFRLESKSDKKLVFKQGFRFCKRCYSSASACQSNWRYHGHEQDSSAKLQQRRRS